MFFITNDYCPLSPLRSALHEMKLMIELRNKFKDDEFAIMKFKMPIALSSKIFHSVSRF